MHNYAALSDHDFELLAASLLEAEFGGRWEAFARGADGGVDVRQLKGQTAHVVQCKHLLGSTMSSLNSAAKKEKKALDKLQPKPATYRFWTTKSLTSKNKATLMGHLKPWIKSVDDIWGQEDIELALLKYPNVERGHVKLWVAGAGQLSAQINGGIWARSRQLAHEIDAALPRYVETGIFGGALEQLEKNRVLIVSGPPGVGKTTVARLLVAQAALDGYEPIEISSDVSEGQQVVDPSRKQIFYYDDFLGSTFLSNRLEKNEDKRLASFMRAAEVDPNTRFVMTTREYILRQAVEEYEELERSGMQVKKFVVRMHQYSRAERGRILYNHVFHSPYVGDTELAQLKEKKRYLTIVDHANYNPRLIEFITLTDPDLRDGARSDFVDYALEALDSPGLIWQRPFESQLDDIGQSLVLLLACAPNALAESDLENSLTVASAAGLCGSPKPGDLEKALKVLDDSFLATDRGGPSGTTLLVKLQNPSIGDFVASILVTDRTRRAALLAAVPYFEQTVWLFENLYPELSPEDSDNFCTELSAAVVRTFDKPVRRLQRYETSYGPPVLEWTYAEVVERLVAVNRMMAKAPSCEALLDSVFGDWLNEQMEKWETDPGSFTSASCNDIVRLVIGVENRHGRNDEFWQGAVDLISQLDPSSWKWEMLRTLADHRGLGVEALANWREEFEAWFDGLLDQSADDVELQDLDDARDFAAGIGATFDDSRFEPLFDELTSRQSQLDDREYDEWKDSRAEDHGEDELQAIFER